MHAVNRGNGGSDPSFARLRAEYRAQWLALPSAGRVAWLKARYLEQPVWDIEFADDLTDDQREELAAWHCEQVRARAAALGCSLLMAGVVEELCRCWLDAQPPQSPYARRVLRAYG